MRSHDGANGARGGPATGSGPVPAPARHLSPLSPVVHAWIERAAGSDAHVVAVETLAASSTRMHRVTVVHGDGRREDLLFRRYHDAARRAADPWYVPAHEARALRLLAGTGVPAPRLLAADCEAAVCDEPALLETWMPGRTDWGPADLERYLRCTAETLVGFHGCGIEPGGLPAYAPYEDRRSMVSPAFTTCPGLWERVARVLAGPPPAHVPIFIHRDWHPGNVLWNGERVTGVVDWTTAARGPAGIDLARMRLNLASRHGRAAADRYLALYVAAGGDAAARHPFWDLLDAADALPDDAAPLEPGAGSLARFEEWVAAVLAEC